jgi:hypothetical protein
MTLRYQVQSEPAPLNGRRYLVRDTHEGDVEEGLTYYSDQPDHACNPAYVCALRKALGYNQQQMEAMR